METPMENSDLQTMLKGLVSAEINTRAICLRVLRAAPVGEIRVLPLLEKLLSDTSPCLMNIPYTFCELRLLAAETLITQRALLDNDLPVFLRETVRPISADDLGLLAESAGVLARGGLEGLLAAFVKLRDLQRLPLFDYLGDPYVLRQSFVARNHLPSEDA